VSTALSRAAFEAILAIDEPLPDPEIPELVIDADDGPFHFGARLSSLINRYHLRSAVYVGGGSVPLFGADDFAALAAKLEARPQSAVTNNSFSSDLVAFPVAAYALEAIQALHRDALGTRSGRARQPGD
jgi:hypothetical protein